MPGKFHWFTRTGPFAGRSTASAGGLLALLAAFGASPRQAAAQYIVPAPPTPPRAAEAVPNIVGQWTGNTEEDGILTVEITPNGQLGYRFSGGHQEHAFGTFQLRGDEEILFTPQGATEPEEWTYSFDADHHLRLNMEEDRPQDDEEYVLGRVR